MLIALLLNVAVKTLHNSLSRVVHIQGEELNSFKINRMLMCEMQGQFI